MPRTRTSTQQSLTRPPPSAVTYTFPKPPPLSPQTSTPSTTPAASTTVTITLPPRSTWTTSPHYHATHTEYLRVRRGSIALSLSHRSFLRFGADDGTITVPRGVVHEWRRADAPGTSTPTPATPATPATLVDDDGDVVVEEWTDPSDGTKEVFFRQLNSVLLEPGAGKGFLGGWRVAVQLFMIMRVGDNYPIVWKVSGRGPGESGLEKGVARAAVWMSSVLGWVMGLRGAYVEYTPVHLRGLVPGMDAEGKGSKKGE